MKKPNNNKAPTRLRLKLLIWYLAIVSCVTIGSAFANYASSAGGSGNVGIAKFSFSDNLSEQSLTQDVVLAPGETESVPIIIENDGDVALRCTVRVENLTDNLPIDDSVIYVDIPIGEERPLTLEIVWPAEKNDASYMGKTDLIRIGVSVEQIG